MFEGILGGALDSPPENERRFCSRKRKYWSATAAVLALTLALLLASRSIAFPARLAPSLQFAISTPSFADGGDIAKKFTCDGADVSPQLAWTDPPAGTLTFALLTDDPDAPVGNWNHWTMWNLPPNLRGLPEGVPRKRRLPDGSQQGENDFAKPGYNGPCPPPGDPHRYYFKLFALDVKLALKPRAGKKELEAAMKQHILAHAEWMGRYGR
jgi:Raf kinase inhibitor-like YbhB/YbcL family protein